MSKTLDVNVVIPMTNGPKALFLFCSAVDSGLEISKVVRAGDVREAICRSNLWPLSYPSQWEHREPMPTFQQAAEEMYHFYGLHVGEDVVDHGNEGYAIIEMHEDHLMLYGMAWGGEVDIIRDGNFGGLIELPKEE